MKISIAEQTTLFLLAGGLGALSGLYFDLLRMIRLIFRTQDVWTALLDVVFWVGALGAFLLFILVPCGGELRFYHLLGAFLGAALYFLTLGPVLVRVGLGAADVIRRVLRFLFSPLIRLVGYCRARAAKRREAACTETGEQAGDDMAQSS